MEEKGKWPFIVSAGDICVMCLRKCSTVKVSNFRSISEFVELDFTKIFEFEGGRAPLGGGEEEPSIEVSLCGMCEARCKTFVDKYTEWRRLGREMEESLQEMHRVVVDAGRDKKKMKEYSRGILERDGDRSTVDVVEARIPELFRKEMIAKGSLKMTEKLPEETSEGDDCEKAKQDEGVLSTEAEWSLMEELRAGNLNIEESLEGGVWKLRYHCMADENKVTGPSTSSSQQADYSGDSCNFTCDLCGRVLASQTNLEIHRRAHLGEKPFECEHCGLAFAGASNCRTHVLRYHGDIFYARYKDSTVSTKVFKAGLGKLIQSVIKDPGPDKKRVLYGCGLCKWVVAKRIAVEEHVLQKHYDVIGKCITDLQTRFPSVSKEECLVHMKQIVRDRNTARACGGCSKRCQNATELNSHVKSHFRVSIERKQMTAGVANSRKNSLIHIKVRCDPCSRYFEDVEELYLHRQQVGGCQSDDALVQCEYCNSGMKRGSLRHHLFSVHRSAEVGKRLQRELEPTVLEDLIRQILLNGNVEGEGAEIKCFICPEKTRIYDDLSLHVMMCHLEELVKVLNEKVNERTDEQAVPKIDEGLNMSYAYRRN